MDRTYEEAYREGYAQAIKDVITLLKERGESVEKECSGNR